MQYKVSPQAMLGTFSVPSDVVDKHIKMAGAVQLKTLLCVFRNPFEPIDENALAEKLNCPAADVRDALMFWAEAGILETEKAPAIKEEKRATVRAAAIKPTREEVARRGLENEEIAFLLREAQQKLGRALRQSEASTLVWLCDDEGMSIAVLLMLLEFAVSDGRANIGFIEKTAISWLDSGVETVADAEQKINEIYINRTAWSVASRAFGLDRRQPGKKEQEFANTWVSERGYGEDMLREAYSRCVDTTGKFSLPYIGKILDKWYKAGVKTVADIPAEQEEKKQNGMGTYDKSAFSSLLSAVDEE